MKIAEIIIGIIALIAIAFNLLHIGGGGLLTVLSLSSASVLYMYLSFAIFNDIRLRHIFKKTSYAGKSKLRIIGAILTGLALSMTIIGSLFKFQSWPGGSFNLIIGLIGLVTALIVGGFKYSQTKSKYYTNIFKRIAICGLLGLILVLLPKETLLEIKYRNHPEYLQAIKNAMANPNNYELWDKVEQERQKMNDPAQEKNNN